MPARREPGVATKLASEAARAGRAAIAVTTSPLDAETRRLVDVATDEGLDLVVAAWGESGTLRDADDHAARLAAALVTTGVTVVEVPVALDDTRLLVDAAGDVVAWGGID